jgi:hypothetical protein
MKEQFLEQDLTREYEALYLRFTNCIFAEKEENRVSRLYAPEAEFFTNGKEVKFDKEGWNGCNFYQEHSGLCANPLQSTNLKDALEEIKNSSSLTVMYAVACDDFAIVSAEESRIQDSWNGDGVNLVAKSMNILYVREY